MNDNLTVAWCDNGMVDGKFMQGVTDLMLHGNINIVSTLRSNGNQIARQRELIITHWYEQDKSDWLLWVDSDVVISPEKFQILWEAKDAETRPIVNGVYFISYESEESLMRPHPALFSWNEDGISVLKHMPKNQLIKVGAAGMGFTLIHRSVITKIWDKLGKVLLYTDGAINTKFTGEDIFFYSLCKMADIPVFAHTGATVQHMKRFSFDENYYDAFTQQSKRPQDHKQKVKGKK